MSKDYGKLTVFELKTKLNGRGARTSGKKQELIKRLEDYDRNNNFQNIVIPQPSQTAFHWPTEQFRSIVHQDRDIIPPLTWNFVKAYFIYRGAIDHHMNSDIKSIEKGKLLAESKSTQACSVLYLDACVYFSSLVQAAMKKGLHYSTKLKIKSSGEIENTSCECPAGQGPHSTCKHIAAVLCMLVEFREKGVLDLDSCTGSLQTFHQPKHKHQGGPVEASKLPGVSTTDVDDDPRPMEYRNAPDYNDLVRTNIISYCGSKQTSITMRYLYKRADLEAAQKDHDYFSIPFVEYLVDEQFKVIR
ncbi:uncharacterized protein LOC144745740 [Ciona intestinalis]